MRIVGLNIGAQQLGVLRVVLEPRLCATALSIGELAALRRAVVLAPSTSQLALKLGTTLGRKQTAVTVSTRCRAAWLWGDPVGRSGTTRLSIAVQINRE